MDIIFQVTAAQPYTSCLSCALLWHFSSIFFILWNARLKIILKQLSWQWYSTEQLNTRNVLKYLPVLLAIGKCQRANGLATLVREEGSFHRCYPNQDLVSTYQPNKLQPFTKGCKWEYHCISRNKLHQLPVCIAKRVPMVLRSAQGQHSGTVFSYMYMGNIKLLLITWNFLCLYALI